MDADYDEYDVFLDTWKPSETAEHAMLPPYQQDALAKQRMLDDGSAAAAPTRTAFEPGVKVMEASEEQLRSVDFFVSHQAEWSRDFRDGLSAAGIAADKIDDFVGSFAASWVDGSSRRQGSPEMMGIKASIRDHDRACHWRHAGKFVLSEVDAGVAATFTPAEMAAIFDVNARLLETVIRDYLDIMGIDSINELYVRRGVFMPKITDLRIDLHYLSSFSFALGPVEQFAQTWTRATKGSGVPCIFSAPLPAIQTRVVAFAPFIEGMDLQQLELVVAPPTEPTPLEPLGDYGGIHEFRFR
jgi:hypothetical protein